MRPFLLLAGILAIAACGTRGPLTLPPPPAKAPLAGKPAPADDSSRAAEAGR